MSGCQGGPATFIEVLEFSAKPVTLAEASETLGWDIPVPAYLPEGYEIKEVYVRDSSVRLLISDEVIEKELVTHTDAAGTCQRYEYQSKMEMGISWHSQGVAGGLKLPGDRVNIGEAQGVIFDAGDHYDLWWQPRPDPQQSGQYEIALQLATELDFLFNNGTFDERRLLCETVLKRLYVKEGKVTRVELNSPFALIASRARGSESVSNGGEGGTRTPTPCGT